MYMPAAFTDEDPVSMTTMVRSIGFGHLVTALPELRSTPLPYLVDRDEDRIVIRGHLGRGNDVHRAAPCEAMLIVAGADAYVSPAWYPSKQIDGKVVPTWNYEVVHLHGRLAVHDDPEWLLSLVGELTNHHEGERARPWSIDDAPTEYINEMLRAIVGIELAVTRWACKRKLSQNRPTDDRAGVAAALGASTRNRDHEVAAAMNR